MPELKELQCEACSGDAPGVDDTEAAELQAHVPDWRLVSRDGAKHLEREFQFGDFAEALDFTEKVGALAERENHHPSLLTEWGQVRVTWWTHKIKGLHRNDFIMAAKTDELYSQKSPGA